MQMRTIWMAGMLLGGALGAPGQWLNHPTPGIPRTKDGKPNLTAPAPRSRDGKTDLSGMWEAESSPPKELEHMLLPGGENGLGEDRPSKYFLNFYADYPFGKEPFQPEAAATFRERLQSGRKPSTLCPPPAIPIMDLQPGPFKIITTPGILLMLYEGDTSFFRQVYTDGRDFPVDPQPSWLGYSTGKWDGEWFVIQTVGFNDKGAVDAMGHSHSENMRLTERFHRRDLGHMDLQITLEDPKTYTKPVTISVGLRLLPDNDLIESFCSEAESDLVHLPGK